VEVARQPRRPDRARPGRRAVVTSSGARLPRAPARCRGPRRVRRRDHHVLPHSPRPGLPAGGVRRESLRLRGSPGTDAAELRARPAAPHPVLPLPHEPGPGRLGHVVHHAPPGVGCTPGRRAKHLAAGDRRPDPGFLAGHGDWHAPGDARRLAVRSRVLGRDADPVFRPHVLVWPRAGAGVRSGAGLAARERRGGPGLVPLPQRPGQADGPRGAPHPARADAGPDRRRGDRALPAGRHARGGPAGLHPHGPGQRSRRNGRRPARPAQRHPANHHAARPRPAHAALRSGPGGNRVRLARHGTARGGGHSAARWTPSSCDRWTPRSPSRECSC